MDPNSCHLGSERTSDGQPDTSSSDWTHTGVSKMRQDHWYFQTGAPPAMEEAL